MPAKLPHVGWPHEPYIRANLKLRTYVRLVGCHIRGGGNRRASRGALHNSRLSLPPSASTALQLRSYVSPSPPMAKCALMPRLPCGSHHLRSTYVQRERATLDSSTRGPRMPSRRRTCRVLSQRAASDAAAASRRATGTQMAQPTAVATPAALSCKMCAWSLPNVQWRHATKELLRS